MSENLNLLRQKYCRSGSFTGKRTDHLFPIRGRVRGREKPCLRQHQKRFCIFKSSIRAVFNRPIETKLAVQNYRFSLSSTSKEATDWLSKLLRIRSLQS